MQSKSSRRELVKESKQVAKRYKGEGLKVKAGLGAVGLMTSPDRFATRYSTGRIADRDRVFPAGAFTEPG